MTDGGAPASDASKTAGAASGCSECGTTATNRIHKERVTAAGKGALSFFRDTLPYIAVGIAIGALFNTVFVGLL